MTHDRDIWESYTRTVKPARERRAPAAKKPAKEKPHRIEDAAPLPRGPAMPLPSVELERRREKAMRRGEIEIEARLDLHGLTQEKAFAALAAFIERRASEGKRHLLVITGKGRDGSGILRANLKDWLGRLPEAGRVLAVRQAAPAHGAAGAFYVILRARRS